MPRGEGGYKSKNKTKDGKNKSWIGKKADGTIGTVWAKGYGPDAKKKKATVSSKSKPKAKPKAKSGATKTSVRPPAGRPAAPKPKPTRRRKSTGGKKTTPAATAATKKTTAGSKGRNATRGKPTMAELASGSTLRPKARPTKPSRRRKSRGGRA